MSEIRTLIIMPAHNEALNISPVIDAIRQHASGIDLLVVNDDSKDGTAEVARRAGAAVITLPCNLGYGGAVQTGFRYAVEHGYEIGLTMDADGQHDAADIPALLASYGMERLTWRWDRGFWAGWNTPLPGSGIWRGRFCAGWPAE